MFDKKSGVREDPGVGDIGREEAPRRDGSDIRCRDAFFDNLK
jgi:hypothetical protein